MLQVRCGPIDPVSEEEPTGRSNPAAEVTPRTSDSACASDARGWRAAARNAPSCSAGLTAWWVKWVRLRMTSSALPGSGAGCQLCPAAWGGLSSNITVIRSVADTPSTMQ